MNNYDFDEEYNRLESDCFKWDGRKRFLGSENLIPMHVADMDFKCAPEILTAIQKRADHPFFGYTIYAGTHFTAMAEWLFKRHQWRVSQQSCIHSPSIVTSLSLIIFSLTNENDGVIVQTPIYPPFMEVVRNNNRKLLLNQLKLSEDGNYEFDFEHFEDLCKLHSPRILLLCNPHNPVGKVWKKNELSRISELSLKYNVIIVSDEVHSDIVYKPNKHIPIASLAQEISQQTITCLSPAKTFNLPGICSSVIISDNKNFRQIIDKSIDRFHLFLPTVFSVLSFESAYKFGESWYENLMCYLLSNRNIVSQWVTENSNFVNCTLPEGTYLAWLSFKKLGLSDLELKNIIYEKGGVALEPGTKFGKGGEGFMRLNYACPKSQLVKALAQIKKAFIR